MMQFSGKQILIFEGRARQCLPLIRSFKKMGCIVSALCASKLDVAYVSRFTDNKIIGICDNTDEEGTFRQLLSIVCGRHIDLIVPTTDFSAGLLSKYKNELEKYTHIASNEWDTYQLAADKLLTMKICMENRIPCPFTLIDATSVQDVIESEIKYPIVMKPRVGYGAIGFRKIDASEDLVKIFENNANSITNYVFQEYIPQTDIQYECAMFMDKNDDVKTALVFSKNRWFPIDGGSSTLNITVDRQDIIASCAKLLKTIHWRGACDIDLIQDPRDNTAKIMEINPRVSGSVKICFDANVDIAKQMIELASDAAVTEYQNYEIGRRLRCSQTDLLWFIKSPNRFKTSPSWFSNKKTKDQIFYLDDPIPWLAFSLSGTLKYKSEMEKRT